VLVSCSSLNEKQLNIEKIPFIIPHIFSFSIRF
jgi:hypothetical protein